MRRQNRRSIGVVVDKRLFFLTSLIHKISRCREYLLGFALRIILTIFVVVVFVSLPIRVTMTATTNTTAVSTTTFAVNVDVGMVVVIEGLKGRRWWWLDATILDWGRWRSGRLFLLLFIYFVGSARIRICCCCAASNSVIVVVVVVGFLSEVLNEDDDAEGAKEN